jgi:penicillin-binding protein 1A
MGALAVGATMDSNDSDFVPILPSDEESPPVAPPPPRKPLRVKIVGRTVFVAALLISASVGALLGFLLVYSTDLPQVGELEHYRPSSVTQIYDAQGRVIGSFALQRRIVVGYDDIPKVLRDAVIAIEDKDFERHWGIDFWRILGAAYRDIASGSRAQGASTLTMQLSRNLFLTPDRKFSRKVQEIMLAIQIERRFTKPQIFTLYANQIYLGHGVYGFEAGAQYYFSKRAKDLTIEEAATLAGLPKAPSQYSPVTSPERALRRRNLVINAMMEDGKITSEQAQRAKASPVKLNLESDINSDAPYFIEEVRRYLEKRFGSEQVHEGGLRVYTSLDLDLQRVAYKAVLDGVAAYERRHGWKASVPNVIAAGYSMEEYTHPDWNLPIAPGSYVHALVTSVSKYSATLKMGKYTALVAPANMAWTQHKSPEEILSVGDLAYVRIVSMSSGQTGRQLRCRSSSNRIPARREPCLRSITPPAKFAPWLVGATSRSRNSTAPRRPCGRPVRRSSRTSTPPRSMPAPNPTTSSPTRRSASPPAAGVWAPHDYDGKFEGTITLRRALAQSRNVPAVRLAARVGIHTVIDYVHKFGITSDIQPYLPVASGFGGSHADRADRSVLHISQ